jgi:probable addiction module antidote protein
MQGFGWGSGGETGLSRKLLYRSFSASGNPALKTILAVMKVLGLS